MAASKTARDTEVEELLDIETEVEIFVVDKNKTKQGGAFFEYLNLTNFDLEKYGLFKNIDRNNYKHYCLHLALKAGGLPNLKLQHLIWILRNAIQLLYVMFWKPVLNIFHFKMKMAIAGLNIVHLLISNQEI